jgi:serine/threonine-protein kinase
MDKPSGRAVSPQSADEVFPGPAEPSSHDAAPEPEVTENRADAAPGQTTVAYEGISATNPTRQMADAPAAPARGPSQKITSLGDYKLVKRLGAGGMGSVYLARQISLDRDVALKVMSRELAAKPHFVERFYREARLMARLDHPNIVHCYGVGQDQGWHYLAMEYIDGGSLARWLKKSGQFSVGDALHVIIACATALQHAHEQQMIHRDVKPDNILISTRGLIKVADLGLAKALDEDLAVTKTGTGAGTPLYMAPEQGRDMKRVDHRSDIYALGCMLYCCLTGRPPYQGETTIEVIEAKEKGKFQPARRSNPSVPERLDLIIDKLLAPRPEHRYQSCAELNRDLSAFGLAGAALEFINPGATTPAVVPAPPRSQPASRPVPKVGPPPRVGPPPARRSEPEPEVSEDADVWYVTYTGPDGRVVTQKLRTGAVLALIRSPQFDPGTQASRRLTGPFRDLGTFSEFAGVVRGRMAKQDADRKSSTFRNLYEQIDEQQKKRANRLWISNFLSGLTTWMLILFWLAVLAVGGTLIFLLVKFIVKLIAAKLDTMS